jgi:hypothetical protein
MAIIAILKRSIARVVSWNSFALAGLILAACMPASPLIYEPSNWKADEADDGAWITDCAGAELRTYRKIIKDVRSRSFRLELEIANRSGNSIIVDKNAELTGGDHQYTGTVFRLFSQEGTSVSDGEYSEFAVLFDLEAPAAEALSNRVRIIVSIQKADGDIARCGLLLDRI